MRALILTHEAAPSQQCYRLFAEQGTQIIAQTNLARRTTPRNSVFGFDKEYTVHGGGIEVRLKYFGMARTDSDTVVYFPAQKVVAVGELLGDETPTVDSAHGGELAGWRSALAEVLKFDFDVVVPAHGKLATRADLESFKAKLDALAHAGAP